jgi:alcohol dehydrogenase (cytochrome c)
VGGAEWNSPAYDPQTNLILGEVEWCDTVTPQSAEKLRSIAIGSHGPEWRHGIRSTCSAKKAVRLMSNYPIVSGMTPTAGGVVFFGDLGGNIYALDAATGEKLWGQDLGGAIAGGVITYTANGAQKVAVATGFTMAAWPTKIVTAKIVILGLDGVSAKQ